MADMAQQQEEQEGAAGWTERFYSAERQQQSKQFELMDASYGTAVTPVTYGGRCYRVDMQDTHAAINPGKERMARWIVGASK
jgi:hypothetical protein